MQRQKKSTASLALCGFVLLVRETVGLALSLGTIRAPCVERLEETVSAMRPLVGEESGLTDADLAWFARDRQGDVGAAASKARRWAEWRRSGFGGLAKSRRSLKRLASTEARKHVGYLAAHRDALGRPVVVVVARRHSVSSRNLVSSQALCLDVLEEAVALLDDEIEQFVGIVDLRHVGTDQVDLAFVLWLVSTLRNYYPKRLGQIVLVDPPALLFKPAWAVVEPALGKHKDVVKLVTASDLSNHYFMGPAAVPTDLVSSSSEQRSS